MQANFRNTSHFSPRGFFGGFRAEKVTVSTAASSAIRSSSLWCWNDSFSTIQVVKELLSWCERRSAIVITKSRDFCRTLEAFRESWMIHWCSWLIKACNAKELSADAYEKNCDECLGKAIWKLRKSVALSSSLLIILHDPCKRLGAGRDLINQLRELRSLPSDNWIVNMCDKYGH